MERFIDLFCGIGGFHLAAQSQGMECVFASDADPQCQRAYQANFGIAPVGDITAIHPHTIPHHDLLCAGFPCQPFSIAGNRRGFQDTRGGLFFNIAQILAAKKPRAVVLENVRQLTTHDNGRTLARIQTTLTDLGYYHDSRILDARDFGLAQKRERVIIVAMRAKRARTRFCWPSTPKPMQPLESFLEPNPDSKHFASAHIRARRHKVHQPQSHGATIWHENKGGNIASHPFSCALRAGASHNYLLVNGERRLTPREMLRLQGFPNSFRIVCSDHQTRKQAGNAAPAPMIAAVIAAIRQAYKLRANSAPKSTNTQTHENPL